MSASEFVLIVGAVLVVLAFAALVVALMRVLDALQLLRRDIAELQERTDMMVVELQEAATEARDSTLEARHDLERFDRVLGSAEAIGSAVSGTVARTAFSSPAIKAAGLAKGTSKAWRRLRRVPDPITPRVTGVLDVDAAGARSAAAAPSRRRRAR